MSDLGILIPLAGIGVGALAVWTRHQRHMAEVHLRNAAESAAQYATRNSELEQRVRVLERIVTEGTYDTALEIEALRERPDAPPATAPGTGGETRQ